MKKLLFPLMLVSGLLLLNSCNEEDSREMLPEYGVNNFEWLTDGAQFVYADYNGDSILISYNLVKSPQIYKKTFQPFPAGVEIDKPLPEGTVLPAPVITYVQPGLHYGKPSLFESDAITMPYHEEIYKFDESFSGTEFFDGKYWTFTTNKIAGQYSVKNTRIITENNKRVLIPAGKDGERISIPCTEILLKSEYSDGNTTTQERYYINEKYGLIKVDGDLTYYELVRASVKITTVPPVNPGPGATYDDYIKGKVNGADFYSWAASSVGNGGLGATVSISSISINNVPPITMISFPEGTGVGTYQIADSSRNYTARYDMTPATSGSITITSFNSNTRRVQGTFQFTAGTFAITEGEFSVELP